MRRAIFGGTFNPVHSGHVRLAKCVLEGGYADEVIVIPDNMPPHKEVDFLASDEDRLEMLRLAFDGISGITISDIELYSEGKSYTVRTMRRLKKLYPDDRLYFVIGSDMLLTFREWYKYEEILTLCGLIAAARTSDDLPKITEAAKTLPGEIIVLPYEALEVSSTEVRERIKKNEDFACYLPQSVVKYIKAKNIYKEM